MVSNLPAVQFIENQPKFLAKRFEKSMRGVGTNEEMLTRIAARCREPALMEAVKQAYQAEYGKTLRQRIEGETGGQYRKLLLALVR